MLDIFALALCAVIGGADHWTGVVEFAQARKTWFASFLELPNGIPSHDTFARVFRLGGAQGIVAIDGKSVRGARDGKQRPLHIVSAWASQSSLLLGQVRTAEKSNEITAIPELLKLLSIQGCIVTIDAMGCQKAIAAEIVKAQADYVLSLKTNHRHLCLQVASWFDKSLAEDFTQQAHSHYLQNTGVLSHGRMERRKHWLIEVPEHLKGATKYWAVENQLHWSLDVGFREDDGQVRKDNAPANLACLRRIALTQLKQETGKKLGIQGKHRRAGWDTDYLEKVLSM